MALTFFTGHIIPLRGPGDKPLDVSELKPELLEEWGSYWRDVVRPALEEALAIRPKASEEEKVRALADTIVVCLTCPLVLDPLRPRPDHAPGVLAAPSRLYYLWLLTRSSDVEIGLWKDENGRAMSLELMANMGFKQLPSAFLSTRPAFARLFKESTHNRLFKLFTSLPADTRPGFNTSRLIVHLLLTSALAYLIAISRGVGGLDLEILRLAALLHDVGKPKAWQEMYEIGSYVDHARKSVELAEALLNGLVSRKVRQILLDVIRYHHKPEEAPEHARALAFLLAEADRVASAEDRLLKAIAEPVSVALGMSIDELRARLSETGKAAWAFWLKLHRERPADVKEATKKAAVALREWGRRAPVEGAKEVLKGQVCLGLADIRGIQRFVMASEKLAGLAVGSYIVEAACAYAIPRALTGGLEYALLTLAPECIIYAGGGNVFFLAPTRVNEEEVEDFLNRALEALIGQDLVARNEPEGLRVSVCLRPLKDPFARTLAEVNIAMSSRKVRPGPGYLARLRLEVSCDSCGLRPAKNGRYCPHCAAREKLASSLNLALGAKWEELGLKDLTGLGWKGIRQYIMEFLAGHDIGRDGKLEPERVLNVCILKFDGNFVGLFMADACTVADAIERSMRVDIATKRALRKFFNALEEGVRRATKDGNEAALQCARAMMGCLYVGGDDGLLILPTWTALPAAFVLCEEFYLEMGGSLSLAVGAASAKARYNIWSLLDAAAALLSRSKKAFRRQALKREPTFKGCVAFLFTEGSVLSGGVASGSLDLMRSLHLSLQPLRIRGEGYSLFSLLQAILELNEGLEREELYSDMFSKAYTVFKVSEGIHERVKEFKEVAKEVASLRSSVRIGVISIEARNLDMLRSLYVKFMASKERDGLRKNVFNTLASLADKLDLRVPAWDIFQVAKFIGGGML